MAKRHWPEIERRLERELRDVQEHSQGWNGSRLVHKGTEDEWRAEGRIRISNWWTGEGASDEWTNLIEIRIDSEYPRRCPRAYMKEKAEICPEFEHVVGPEDELCCAPPPRDRQIWEANRTLEGFLDKLVVRALCANRHWERFGRAMGPETAHGREGVEQARAIWPKEEEEEGYPTVRRYEEALKVEGLDTVIALLEAKVHRLGGARPCPCGSGRHWKSCRKRHWRGKDWVKRDVQEDLSLLKRIVRNPTGERLPRSGMVEPLKG